VSVIVEPVADAERIYGPIASPGDILCSALVVNGPMIGRAIAAAALSNLGDGLRAVALPLLAVTLTHDPLLVSGLVVAAYVPWVVFGLPIGTLVDRGRPERFMRLANVGRAILLTLLVAALATDLVSIWLLYVVAFLLGIGEALYDNAAQSLVPRLVDSNRLEAANGALVTAERVGEDLAGPAVAGLLFTTAAVLPFGLNALLTAVSAVLLVSVRSTSSIQAARLTGVVAETVAGLRWLWKETFIRRLVLTGAVLVFATWLWESTLVLLATKVVGLTAAGYGLALALGGLGGVIGAVATPRLVVRMDRWLLQLGSIGLCGLCDLLLAISPSAVTVALAWGGTGFGFALWHVISLSTRQRVVPENLLARVNSAARTLSITALPTGALAGGILANAVGLRAPAIVSGGGILLLLLAYAATSRRDRALLQPAPAQLSR
jgi:MFS family permease